MTAKNFPVNTTQVLSTLYDEGVLEKSPPEFYTDAENTEGEMREQESLCRRGKKDYTFTETDVMVEGTPEKKKRKTRFREISE